MSNYRRLYAQRCREAADSIPTDVETLADKRLSLNQGALVFSAVALTGLSVSAAIATYTFFGVVTLAGLVAVTEASKPIKKFVIRHNKAVDILLFIGSVASFVTLGVTTAASLTVVGLGYSLVYRLYLLESR